MADIDASQLRVPPNSVEAESSVLGGLLLDNSAWDRVGDLLCEDDFYRFEHRLVFGALSALVNNSKPADVITVFEHLKSTGNHTNAGGMEYLNDLAQYVPSASTIRRYAEIVRECAMLRRLIKACDQIGTSATNPMGKPVDHVLDESEQLIFRISEAGGKLKTGFQGIGNLAVGLMDMVMARADSPS